MTQPALVLDAVVQRLRARLSPPGEPIVDVRAIDSPIDDIGSVTFRPPAVLVSATGMSEVERGFSGEALSVDLSLVARCIARVGQVAEGEAGRGDAAMNLAAIVASEAASSLWPLSDGSASTMRVSSRVTVRNRTHTLEREGHALWTVSWSQMVELTARDVEATLHALRRYGIDYEIGTDVVQTLVEVPKGAGP